MNVQAEFSIELVTGIADVGACESAYCGGIEATAQEKGRTSATLFDIGRWLAAVVTLQLATGKITPIAIQTLDGRDYFGIGDAMRFEFRENTTRPVAIGRARACQQFGKAFIALIFLIFEGVDRLAGFAIRESAAGQLVFELALGLLTSHKQTQRLVVGAGVIFRRFFWLVVAHKKSFLLNALQDIVNGVS